jgi:Cu(I)/Ag(I) efflux system membrane fusion protein
MKQFLNRLRPVLAFVWKRTSAAIAVILIIIAFIIGLSIRGGGEGGGADGKADDVADEASDEPQWYYCSMHPQVRSKDPNAKCDICFMDLVPMPDGQGGDLEPNQLRLSKSAAKLSEIETARVGRFFPTASVRLYGKVTYDETSVARITAYFPGRLDRLFLNYIGVPVAKGDHVAEIYSPDLLAAFEELRQARIAADESRTSSELVRNSTQQTLEAAREKLRLFGLTETQIEEAEAGEFTGDQFTIYTPIKGVVTELMAREGDYVKTGSRIATVADLSRLWLDMEAYESQLPLLRWGQRVEFTVEAHPGEKFEGWISFIEPMVDEHTRTAAVRVAVDNSDGRLKPGMFASAVVRTRVAAGGALVSDELVGKWVGPMHPTVVRDEPGECDICGMDLVRAESLGVVGDPSELEEPLVIPRSAAMLTGKRAIVYISVPDAEEPTYEAREVVLGPRAGEYYIVDEGLREGEMVVVKGSFRIDSAMQLAAKPSMMLPGGGDLGKDATASSTKRVDAPTEFVYDLKPVYAAYLDAQAALAGDDLSGFLLAADDLETAIRLVDEVGLIGEPLETWRHTANRLRIDDVVTTIDVARERFERMSTAIITLEQTFGHHGSETWHVAFCPMAFNNKGAEWLQRGTQINNPYFGSSMLRCGEIRHAFRPLSDDRDDRQSGGRND